MFVFDAKQNDHTTFMMNVNPTTSKDDQAAFGENGVYSFHIASDQQLKSGGLTITTYLSDGKFVFGLADGAKTLSLAMEYVFGLVLLKIHLSVTLKVLLVS